MSDLLRLTVDSSTAISFWWFTPTYAWIEGYRDVMQYRVFYATGRYA